MYLSRAKISGCAAFHYKKRCGAFIAILKIYWQRGN